MNSKTVILLLVSALGISNCSSIGFKSEYYIDGRNTKIHNRLVCDQGITNEICELRLYQVMVEAFIDGDPSADWNAGYGTSLHKGDLQGIIDSLQYIKSLGMNGIWLTPVFDSPGRWVDLHATGYFASNMFDVDHRFGDKEKLKELIDKAHSIGIYVFFDGVLGRSEKDTVASPSGRTPSGKSPAIYPDDLEYFKELARFWITEYKIDGWRMDQAYLVPVEYWKDIRLAIEDASRSTTYTDMHGNAVHPLGYMFGEFTLSPEEIAELAYGPADDPSFLSAIEFPLRWSILQAFTGDQEAEHGKRASALFDDKTEIYSHYPAHAIPNLTLGSHDMPRLGDLIQRAELANKNDKEYWDRLKNILAYLAAFSGPITVYYGEEIGDEVPEYSHKVEDDICAALGLCEDHASRSPAKIEGVATYYGGAVTELTAQEKDMKNYFIRLMNIRDQNKALSSGKTLHLFSNDSLYIDRKEHETNSVLYLANLSGDPHVVQLDPRLFPCESLFDLWKNQSYIVSGETLSIEIQPHSSLFYRIDRDSECS